MSFALDFRRFPDAEGPLEIARVSWDSEIFELPIHELRCRDELRGRGEPDRELEPTGRVRDVGTRGGAGRLDLHARRRGCTRVQIRPGRARPQPTLTPNSVAMPCRPDA